MKLVSIIGIAMKYHVGCSCFFTSKLMGVCNASNCVYFEVHG